MSFNKFTDIEIIFIFLERTLAFYQLLFQKVYIADNCSDCHSRVNRLLQVSTSSYIVAAVCHCQFLNLPFISSPLHATQINRKRQVTLQL